MTSRNEELFAAAQRHIPGGVNSPVRAFRGVGGTPRFFASGKGPRVTDADGKVYIDYVGSWGPLILGHADPDVLEAVQTTAARGLTFGAPTGAEVDMADLLCEMLPSLEMVRLVSSGTEATMSAIRLARGFTGRDLIIKFEGCYHGHADSLLVKAGSGLLTFGNPSSGGVPADVAAHTLVLPYNDIAAFNEAIDKYADKLAAVIVEPIAGNMNLVDPGKAFLQGLRDGCTRVGAVLIFDEVMTGFRVGLGGAQAHYGVTPDLTTLGKIIGAGLPVGAFGGKREVMECIAPLGKVYQAGTLSGNPLAMRAGIEMFKHLRAEGFYENLTAQLKKLLTGLQAAADEAGIPFKTQQVGAMFGLYFTDQDDITSFDSMLKCDVDAFRKFFHGMLQRGVNLAPSAFEAGFISSAHSDEDIAFTIQAAKETFAEMKA